LGFAAGGIGFATMTGLADCGCAATTAGLAATTAGLLGLAATTVGLLAVTVGFTVGFAVGTATTFTLDASTLVPGAGFCVTVTVFAGVVLAGVWAIATAAMPNSNEIARVRFI
jgi:hypothetical protein